MKKKLFILVIIMMSLNKSYAAITYGAGTASCGAWVKASRDGGSNYAFNLSWVHGYLSALQVPYDLKEADNSSIRLFLDEYCKSNPFDSISDAVHKLSLELIE